MALNKQLYKTPEDKMKAFRLFREQNCSDCMGCRPCGGPNSAFYIQMCFTAWLESDAKDSFAENCDRTRAPKIQMPELRKQYDAISKGWAVKHPMLNPCLNPKLLEPPFLDNCKWGKRLSLDFPVYEYNKYTDYYHSDLAGCSFHKREGKFAVALGAKTVKTLLEKTDEDLNKAALKAGVGKAMIKKFAGLIADTRKFAQELGLVK